MSAVRAVGSGPEQGLFPGQAVNADVKKTAEDQSQQQQEGIKDPGREEGRGGHGLF